MYNENLTITLTAIEMATIREALRYAAEQVHDSDVPAFESFEVLDKTTGEVLFNEYLHETNQAKADLAFELADTLDLIKADCADWRIFNSRTVGNMKDARSTFTLSAIEMAAIREALRYAAEQVHDSDVPVFECFETWDKNTGEVTFDDDLHYINQVKADLAFELADTLDLIEADSADWEVLSCEASDRMEDTLSVMCLHHKVEDFGTHLLREFIWHYAPKQSGMPATVHTSVYEDREVPLNTEVAVHYVPYVKLDGASVVKFYNMEELKNGAMDITGDADLDEAIMTALWVFIRYHG